MGGDGFKHGCRCERGFDVHAAAAKNAADRFKGIGIVVDEENAWRRITLASADLMEGIGDLTDLR